MLDAISGQQAYEDRASDGAEPPHDVQYCDEACTFAWNRGAGDNVAGGEACSEPKADAEQCDVCRAEADPRHGDASSCSHGGAIEDACAEIARGEPGSAELASKVGSEKRAGLSVLNLPALYQCRKK